MGRGVEIKHVYTCHCVCEEAFRTGGRSEPVIFADLEQFGIAVLELVELVIVLLVHHHFLRVGI